jgi:prophage DNA circulation protein
VSPRYKAQLDGFLLDLETIDDKFEKAVARYEYPFRDGADLDDMGMKARVISFRCYFYEDTYATTEHVVAHIQLKKTDGFELVHPAFGTIFGQIESMSVRHDDRLQTAELDITFVEQIQEDTTPVFTPDILSSCESQFASGQAQLIANFAQSLQDTLGAEGLRAAAQKLIPGPALNQIQGLSAAGRLLVRGIDTAVSSVEGLLTDITQPANTVIGMIDYGSTLPGRVIGAVANVVERYALSLSAVASAPSRFVDSLKAGLADLKNSVSSLSPYIGANVALYGSVKVAELYAADEVNRQTAETISKVPAFDLQGNYVRREAPPVVATINELEASLASMREIIQLAVDNFRDMTSLKAQALALLYHVNTVRIERERIITIEVHPATPLHLVCLQNGLPYTYADRILAINDIPEPSFVEGRIRIYAR